MLRHPKEENYSNQEISNFAKLMDNIVKHYDYDPGKVIKEFSDLDKLRKDHDFLASIKIPSLQKMVDGLEAERSILQIQVDINNQVKV